MEKNIIAAVSDNCAIGRRGTIPWHISEDLKYFRRVTTGSTVIMGRKTFQSIGKPLPGRTNIVITRSSGKGFPEGTITASSLEEALSIAGSYGKPCFIIGGGEIYRQAMDVADRLYITHVHTSISEADAFFPEISPETWKKISSSETAADPESGYRYEFSVYERIL